MDRIARLMLGISLCVSFVGCIAADDDGAFGLLEAAIAGDSVTLSAAEDTFVNAGFPDGRFGTRTELKFDDRPKIAYLKFKVTGIPSGATVSSATLKLTATAGGSRTVDVHTVGNTWNESTTYITRPALGAKVTSVAVKAGSTVSFAVPVSGNGTVSFAIVRTTAGLDGVVASSEHRTGAARPSLTVSFTSGTTEEPAPEPEPEPSPEPTPDSSWLPYTADSFFKSRVDGSSVPVDATRTKQFHSFMASHPEQANISWPKVNMNENWAVSYDYGTSDDPIWHLKGGNTTSSRLAVVAVGGKGFHMDDSVAQTFPTGDQDRPGVIIDIASGFTVQFADAVPDLATRTITVSNAGIMWHSSNGLDYRNPKSNDNRNFTSRGRLLDAMIVTREDLDRAVANDTGVGHVVQWYFVETLTSDGFVHPMAGEESTKYGWGAEGERLRIKPSVDLKARGLTGHALALARTMQEHGAYLGDNSGSSTQVKLSQAFHYEGTNLTTDVFKGKLSWTDFEVVQAGWQ